MEKISLSQSSKKKSHKNLAGNKFRRPEEKLLRICADNPIACCNLICNRSLEPCTGWTWREKSMKDVLCRGKVWNCEMCRNYSQIKGALKSWRKIKLSSTESHRDSRSSTTKFARLAASRSKCPWKSAGLKFAAPSNNFSAAHHTRALSGKTSTYEKKTTQLTHHLCVRRREGKTTTKKNKFLFSSASWLCWMQNKRRFFIVDSLFLRWANEQIVSWCDGCSSSVDNAVEYDSARQLEWVIKLTKKKRQTVKKRNRQKKRAEKKFSAKQGSERRRESKKKFFFLQNSDETQ